LEALISGALIVLKRCTGQYLYPGAGDISGENNKV
jgi:hypothetical protein